MSDVSDMLLEFYKANTAKAPKNDNLEKHIRQSSPSSADGAVPPLITPTNGECLNGDSKIPNEPTTTATATVTNIDTASKNLNGDEIAINDNHSKKNNNMPFHPRIKYSSVKNKSTTLPVLAKHDTTNVAGAAAAAANAVEQISIAPVLASVMPTGILSSTPSSVIKPPVITNPAALAAVLFRDGYNTFQQQLRAHELIKQSGILPSVENNQNKISNDIISQNQQSQDNAQLVNVQQYLPKENRSSEYDEGSDDYDSADGHDEENENDDDDDDDEDGRYPAFDDIHLIEGSKLNYANQMNLTSGVDYLSDDSSHKYNLLAAQALRNLEYSFNDFGNGVNSGEEPLYQCRHCGKKYRWKSTLRRHENVECGGKEPSHQCPYCPYKSKQRGNLGVHVRKHHSNLPQLASKRRSKYSQGSGAGGDLSNSSVKDEKD